MTETLVLYFHKLLLEIWLLACASSFPRFPGASSWVRGQGAWWSHWSMCGSAPGGTWEGFIPNRPTGRPLPQSGQQGLCFTAGSQHWYDCSQALIWIIITYTAYTVSMCNIYVLTTLYYQCLLLGGTKVKNVRMFLFLLISLKNFRAMLKIKVDLILIGKDHVKLIKKLTL